MDQTGSVGSFCDHSNKMLCSIKADKFHDELREYSLLEKNSALWSYLRSLNNTFSVEDTGIRIKQQESGLC